MSVGDWNDVRLPLGWRLEVLDEVSSTNDVLRDRGGEAEGLVVLSETQTAGRGRRGAAWVSEGGGSLTFSVLLRPRAAKALWARLSLAAGVAVAQALGRCGLEAEIKWPNDVLVGGKKLCGILVDAAGDSVIVGIGLNVGIREFPVELEGLATSMALEGSRTLDRSDVLGLVLASLAGWTDEIGEGFPAVVRQVRERCALSGKRVRLIAAGGIVEGVVMEVATSGELVLETPAGPRRFLQANEVRVI